MIKGRFIRKVVVGTVQETYQLEWKSQQEIITSYRYKRSITQNKKDYSKNLLKKESQPFFMFVLNH